MHRFRSYLAHTKRKQAEIARLIGISRGHMSALVSGKKRPGRAVAVKIERATDGFVPASSWDDPVQP